MSDINDISSYDYFLPSELIAKEPVLPKEEARLLVYLKKTKGKVSSEQGRDKISYI